MSLPALSPDSVARIHWLGKKRLGVMASAYYVTRVWELPETKQMEAQTLDKLAMAPWRLLIGDAALQNAPVVLLRPLLDDAVQGESYFEFRQATNQPAEIVFAIRLDENRAGFWRTNLVAVVASLTGIQTMDIRDGGNGWVMKKPGTTDQFELMRVGDWTVLGFGPDKSRLLTDTLALLKKPSESDLPPSKNWLRADLDMARLKIAPSVRELPRLTLEVTGDGGNVLTHAQLTFPASLGLQLEPWLVPTNLIHDPLVSLTAIRGIRWPEEMVQVWNQFGAPPQQLYAWSLPGGLQTYFAAPVPSVSQQVEKLTTFVMEKGNPWLESHGYINFERSPDSNGATWGNLPSVRPFFRAADGGGFGVIYGGLIPEDPASVRHPLRPELLQKILQTKDLVAFSWESTAEKTDSARNVAQFLRLILRQPQFPLDLPSANWLRMIVARLGDSETMVTLERDNQLAIQRKSTLGLTGWEFNLLIDWLESPQFPRGLYSTVVKPAPPAEH